MHQNTGQSVKSRLVGGELLISVSHSVCLYLYICVIVYSCICVFVKQKLTNQPLKHKQWIDVSACLCIFAFMVFVLQKKKHLSVRIFGICQAKVDRPLKHEHNTDCLTNSFYLQLFLKSLQIICF